MRYVLAITSLVLAGVLLLLGLGQRTVFAGPSEIRLPLETNSEAAYAVIDGGELAKIPGQANVRIAGEDAFVATAMTRDVEAWVEPVAHAELLIDAGKQEFVSAHVVGRGGDRDDANQDGEADGTAIPSPRGSDLWIEERSLESGETETEQSALRMPLALSDDQSLLIAADGEKPLPADVSLEWVQDQKTPWAGPLLLAGGVLAVFGGIMYLLAIERNRRSLGPQRGRSGPFIGIRNSLGRQRKEARRAAAALPAAPEHPVERDTIEAPEASEAGPETEHEDLGDEAPADGSRAEPRENGGRSERRALSRAGRRFAVPIIGASLMVGLSGCSAEYWPDFSQEAPETTTEAPADPVAPVPVTEAQIDRIVQDVVDVAAAGDESLDAADLESRFTGDALLQRSASYKIRGEVPDYQFVPPKITGEQLGYTLVQSTEGWPRTLLVTLASQPGGESKPDADEEEAKDADATDSSDDAAEPQEASASLALVMTQREPHENFMVRRVVALRGGIEMPQAAPASDGTALLPNDLETVRIAPGEVGDAYAKVLEEGADIPEAADFDLTDDKVLENYGKALTERLRKEAKANDEALTFSVHVAQGSERVIALSTGLGGALVATTIVEEQTTAGDDRWKPQAQGVLTALSGLEGEQDRIVQQISHQMLFFVPSKNAGGNDDDNKIEVLGTTSQIVGVRN